MKHFILDFHPEIVCFFSYQHLYLCISSPFESSVLHPGCLQGTFGLYEWNYQAHRDHPKFKIPRMELGTLTPWVIVFKSLFWWIFFRFLCENFFMCKRFPFYLLILFYVAKSSRKLSKNKGPVVPLPTLDKLIMCHLTPKRDLFLALQKNKKNLPFAYQNNCEQGFQLKP